MPAHVCFFFMITERKMSKNRVATKQDKQYNLQHQKEINMESTLRQPGNDPIELSDHYKFIEQAIQFIEANVQRQPELEEIASAIGLRGCHLPRRITRRTVSTPNAFTQFLSQ